jgi:hypothetical protein
MEFARTTFLNPLKISYWLVNRVYAMSQKLEYAVGFSVFVVTHISSRASASIKASPTSIEQSGR